MDEIDGLKLLDTFAAAALTGMLAACYKPGVIYEKGTDPDELAIEAYAYARAMLWTRKQYEGKEHDSE